MEHRNLSPDEIYLLENQDCHAQDWMRILVKDPFRPDLIWHTIFEGDITLGSFGENINHDVGIFRARIGNCLIGNNVKIEHVNFLYNYQIGDDSILENIGTLTVNGDSTFGNGTEVEVLNEAGGRTLPIYDTLSAQIAWLMVMCRHENQLISQLKKLIGQYTDSKKSSYGSIGQGAMIRNCSSIENVNIEAHAELTGVQSLKDGTILSNEEAVTKIGQSVIANHFIIQDGSEVTNGAILDKCFVGQAVKIGKQYSAENSVFFANSEGFHGEACSIFAGPYTVTHHKSSLLIAGQFSFYNAGSGTNQSNHMYKLGPMHQGIVERGSKTGSFSYMLWPSKVGPYSVVMGKHTTSFDAGDFPFSYITEEHGKSMLTPAMNLFTVGTKRDIQKWPARDRRKAPIKYDQIIFDLYSPYIMQKVKKAIQKLDELYQKTPKEQDLILLKGLHMHRLMLKTCRKYYELAIQVFLGEGMLVLLNQLKSDNPVSELQKLANTIEDTTGEWLDVAGLFMLLPQIDKLIEEIKGGKISSIHKIQDYFADQVIQYGSYKASYFQNLLRELRSIELASITGQQIVDIINDWKSASIKLNNMILKDAEKEFDATSHIGYGISSTESVREADFVEVHGSFDANGFVKGLKNEIELINHKVEEIMAAFS